MTGQPQLPPGAKQLQHISKATSGHARSSSLLSPPLNWTWADVKQPNNSQSPKEAEVFSLGRLPCQPKRCWACMERTNTQQSWLQILCAAQQDADGLLDGASQEQGAMEKQPFLVFNPLFTAMHPSPLHILPFASSTTSFNGFSLDRVPHTGTSLSE